MTDKSAALAIDPVAHVRDLPFLAYKNGVLHIEDVSVLDLQRHYPTPCYIYSKNAIVQAYKAYQDGFCAVDHQICYAVKANSNLAVLKTLADLGAGFDIVSKGELLRVLQVSDAKKVVFSGVGKSKDDLEAALLADIDCFNVEALSELDRLNDIAKKHNKKARVSLRINPDVDAKTHPYISTGLKDNKFGIDHRRAVQAYERAASLPFLQVVGIDCHIGSQLLEVAPFVDALDRLIALIDDLAARGIALRHIDLGGGLGARYIDEKVASVGEYAQALLPKLQSLGLKLYLEPGRNIVANAGVLLTSVDTLKRTDAKNFAVVDASMSELMRPALYGAKMAVAPTRLVDRGGALPWDIVGSVCESADFLAKDRQLDLQEGDVLAITGAGAYGFCMASNYNSRPRPCEALVDGASHRLIRKKESYESLWQDELP